MPRLIIDDREIDVEDGVKVIDAAERLGIMIPRFCYHPALGAVGACRVCAVKVLDGPLKGVRMSCMIDAAEGMRVSTTDPEAVDFRMHVIEWLMANHPHDCPVCDEGGHCLLQDMTVSGGHGLRRFPGNKRTHRDQYLGPLIQHEMNRCIQCYRCVRYYREYAGYDDLGVMGVASRVYYGRFEDGTLESPFAGNLIDICPTGVYTDKPSRFKSRRWDCQRAASLCLHCSLGCNIVAGARYREVLRHEGRYNPHVNGYFICDRGRYGFSYAGAHDRPYAGRADGAETASWTDAADAAMTRLARIEKEFGPQAVAVAGSRRCSLNTMARLNRVCRTRSWTGPAFWPDAETAGTATAAASRLEPDLSMSMADVEGADFILIIGADPLNEGPMLAQAVRQAWRKGAGIAVIDPRPVALPCAFDHVAARPEEMDQVLAALLTAVVDKKSVSKDSSALAFYEALAAAASEDVGLSDDLTAALRQSKRPAVICGTGILSDRHVHLAADAACLLKAAGKDAGLFFLLSGPNAFGAALATAKGPSLADILTEIEGGKIKALVLAECDPSAEGVDPALLERALKQLDLLVVLDYLDAQAARAADVFIPLATIYETGGCFVNAEGRIQQARPVFSGGVPISLTGRGGHPPREFSASAPGAGLKAGWQALEAALPESADTKTWDKEDLPGVSNMADLEAIPEHGLRLARPATGERFASRPERPGETDSGFDVILTDLTFGTEPLSGRSQALNQLETPPFAAMRPEDAESLGLKDGERITIQGQDGSVTVHLKTRATMACGVVVMPKHRLLNWQVLSGGGRRIDRADIRKKG